MSSERGIDDKADSVLRRRGQIVIVDAVYVLNLYQAEDVLNADGILQIGFAAIHDIAIGREDHQP